MADDTRLAEASLLLNYSHQSYREQMIAKQRSQRTETSDQKLQTTILDKCDQLNEKTISSKLITPPPEHDYSVESQESSSLTASHCLESPPGSEVTVPCNFIPDNGDKLDDQYLIFNTHSNSMISTYGNSNCETDREPINNLLAAVNCALPGLKSRPTILQRAPATQSLTGDATTLSAKHIPDHDYCHQEPEITMSHAAYELSTMIEASSHPKLFRKGNLNSTGNLSSSSKRKQEHIRSHDFSLAHSDRPLKLVAVHLGAGNSYYDKESLSLAKEICEQVMLQSSAQLLTSSSKKRRKNSLNSTEQVFLNNQSTPSISSSRVTAELAVVHLVKLMEDHQSLNCGYGSNLNIKGQVECDASLMSDETQMWAGVGAVSGCKNPILLAKSLYDHRIVPRPLDLIQPNLLVSSGAKQWMRERCPHLSVMDSKMVSSKAFSTYQKLKSKYDLAVKSTALFFQETKSVDTSRGYTRKIKNLHRKIPTERLQHGSTIEQFQNYEANDSADTGNNKSSTKLDHGFYCVTGHSTTRRKGCHVSTNREIESPGDLEGNILGIRQTAFDPSHSMEDHAPFATKHIKSHANHSNHLRLDTVGAIAVDCNNNFASAISSGGILLKYKGRVGQAAVPGAGCWSEDSVAITTTGVGEYLTLSMFAKKFNDKMQTLRLLYDLGHVEKKPDLSGMINDGIEECFEDLMNSAALAHVHPRERLAGMLAVSTLNSKNSPERVDKKDLYLSYAHNTNSMCVGYMTCDDIAAHSVMSRQDTIPENDDNKGENCEPLVRTVKFSLEPGRN